MQLGMIGLGRMGANIVRRLMDGGHECVVYARRPESRQPLEQDGARRRLLRSTTSSRSCRSPASPG